MERKHLITRYVVFIKNKYKCYYFKREIKIFCYYDLLFCYHKLKRI